ncbi:MAG: Ig-like domain-containing protein [Chitinophagaceae bacterium]
MPTNTIETELYVCSRMRKTALLFLLVSVYCLQMVLLPSCANIIPPVGGPRDSFPPVLLKAIPGEATRNFSGNRITLQFDEYVEVQNAFENVLVSPAQEKFPQVDYKLRTVTIRLKDTLEPNTTYSIRFGNAIKDVNEGNVLKDFSYVFSTGNRIDSLQLEGTVTLAETGKVDSSLLVVLYNKLYDSAVAKEKPRYITRLDGKGRFRFENLPSGTFNLFTFKDEGFKKYSSNTILFGFAGVPISLGTSNKPVDLLVFAGEKEPPKEARPASASKETKEDKRLRFQVNLQNGQQGLQEDFEMRFAKPLKEYDSTRITLTDTSYNRVKGYKLSLDTSKKILTIKYPWQPDQFFKLLVQKDAATDTSGNAIAKSDTIRIRTRSEDSYGSILMRFTNLDLKRNPVLQWITGEDVYKSFPLTGIEWRTKLFEPNGYTIRILYDDNKNGVWDTGNYWTKKQPEKVISIDQKFNVRANWDNEFTVVL